MEEKLSASVEEIMARKEGIFVAVPNIGSEIATPLAMWINSLAFITIDQDSPYFFKVFLPNDLTPVEYARNECVKEFLSDPYYKRLWFVDADVVPPNNALELLESPAAIASGMTYIWHCEHVKPSGEYVPPEMNIHGYNYIKKTNNFQSLVPPRSNVMFECDAAGCACLVVKREVFEAVPEPWFRTLRDGYGKTLRGEDLDFCKRANDKGYRVSYYPRVMFGHQKTIDLQQVLRYGISCMKNVADKIRAGAEPPIIEFNKGKASPTPMPANFEVVKHVSNPI